VGAVADVTVLAPEAAADEARGLVAQGYTALKTSPYPLTNRVVAPQQLIRAAVAKVKAKVGAMLATYAPERD
jgi:hypothetical protein